MPIEETYALRLIDRTSLVRGRLRFAKKANRQMDRITEFCLVIFFAVVLIFTGCGKGDGETGFVSGKVTIPDSQNPSGLLVRFVNGATGMGATAVVNDDGTYELKHKGYEGIPIGVYKISVTAYVPQMSDKEYTDFMSSPPAQREKIEKERNAKKNFVPKKYHKASSSGLSYEVVSGSQVHNLSLAE